MRFWASGSLVLLLLAAALRADDFQDAVAAFQRGDAAAAEAMLDRVLQANPNDRAALGLLGPVLDLQKKFADADAVYQRALKLAPNSAVLLNNFANHQMATGDIKGARATYTKVLTLDPRDPSANEQLAALSVDQKDGATALRCLQRLPQQERSQPAVTIIEMRALYLAGRTAEGDAILQRLTDEAKTDPRLGFTTGVALAALGRYAAAETFFSSVLEAAPSNFDVLYNLGLAASHAGHYQRAQEAMQSALQQKPQDVDTFYNLAAIDVNLGEREAALSVLAQAARLDPSRANVQRLLAETATALGYYNDAALAWQKYIVLAPADSEARRELAFATGAGGKAEEGISKLQLFLREHPDDATAHYDLAILEATSNPGDAAAHLNRALSLRPDFAPARFGRGVLNALQGNPSAALGDLEFGAARYPDNPWVLDSLGKAYMDVGRYADAVKTLRHAAAVAPGNGRVLMHLSRALSETGNSEEAHAILERYRAVGPDQGNRVPAAGLVEFLSLRPEQQRARYEKELSERISQDAGDPELNVRYLKLLLDEGKSSEALEVGARLLPLNPPAPLAADAGKALLQANEFAAARPLLELAVKKSATPDSRIDLALARLHTEGAAAALAELEQIPEAQRSGDFFLAEAVAFDGAGRGSDAVSALEHAATTEPSRADLYQEAALFLARQHRAADAVTLLERAPRALRDSPKMLLLKAAMLAAVPRTDAAEQVLKDIQNRWPEWAPSYVTYGILLEGEKRAKEAKTQLETALQLGASGPEAYLYLAKSTLDATPDRLDDAARAIAQAVTLAPTDPQTLALAGRIDYERHDYAAAVQHLEAAVHERPDYLQARFTLAQAYRALGRSEDAARESKEFQRLRAANPNADDDLGGLR